MTDQCINLNNLGKTIGAWSELDSGGRRATSKPLKLPEHNEVEKPCCQIIAPLSPYSSSKQNWLNSSKVRWSSYVPISSFTTDIFTWAPISYWSLKKNLHRAGPPKHWTKWKRDSHILNEERRDHINLRKSPRRRDATTSNMVRQPMASSHPGIKTNSQQTTEWFYITIFFFFFFSCVENPKPSLTMKYTSYQGGENVNLIPNYKNHKQAPTFPNP